MEDNRVNERQIVLDSDASVSPSKMRYGRLFWFVEHLFGGCAYKFAASSVSNMAPNNESFQAAGFSLELPCGFPGPNLGGSVPLCQGSAPTPLLELHAKAARWQLKRGIVAVRSLKQRGRCSRTCKAEIHIIPSPARPVNSGSCCLIPP